MCGFMETLTLPLGCKAMIQLSQPSGFTLLEMTGEVVNAILGNGAQTSVLVLLRFLLFVEEQISEIVSLVPGAR